MAEHSNLAEHSNMDLDGSLSIAAKKYNCSTLKPCFCCHAENIYLPLWIWRFPSWGPLIGPELGLESPQKIAILCISIHVWAGMYARGMHVWMIRYVCNYSISACPNTWTAWPISASMLASGAFDLAESSCLQTYGETNLRANALHRKNSWKRSRNYYKIREIFLKFSKKHHVATATPSDRSFWRRHGYCQATQAIEETWSSDREAISILE